jgi:glucose-fructose oxidoreductase
MPRSRKTWRIAGICFDFRHMDHLLAQAQADPRAEIVGICHEDPTEMVDAQKACGLGPERVFTDWRHCLEATRPDVVILCPAYGRHAEWVGRVAPYGVHVLIEKPFAADLAQADRMITAMRAARRQLAINWPLAWYAPHVTAYRLLQEGRIGDLQEVHFYDGNRGPIIDRRLARPPEPTRADKRRSWFYQPGGGGSLIDYLGYGATLATWFFDGRRPTSITAMSGGDPKLPVDEQSVTIARYGTWLSTFQTRWGTLTDPWLDQPQPKCGFVLKGTEGNIAHYDYEENVRMQTLRHPAGKILPVDKPRRPRANPVQYLLHCLETGEPIEGPLSVAYSRIGQQIMDTARASARMGRTLALLD